MKLPRLLGLLAMLALAGCAAPLGTHPDARPDQQPAQAAAKAQSAAVQGPSQAQSASTAVPPVPPAIPSAPLEPIATQELTSTAVAQLQPPQDLWERIRRGFAMPNLDNKLVHLHEQAYASRPEYMQRMTDRSRKYLFHIVEELERRNMPTELALLPFVESAFNPEAVSSARAAGMWQFMPATGRLYDLKQNFFRDDRRDVLASTRAALDYLQKLYAMFGDWHLALAAYNWGEGSVARAIAYNQRKKRGTSYSDLKMPNETRNYVPKLQAVKNIVANPQQFHAELPPIDNHPYFQSVTVGRDIDVELAAKLAEVKLEDFKALNPQLHRPVIIAAGTPQILLPWDNAAVFKRNYEAYNEGQYATWTVWSAPTNMTVADVAKRVGMSEADLRSVNTIPPRMLIKAGSVLIVPRTPARQEDVTSHVAENGQLDFMPEGYTRRMVVRARKRDSVASVARRYRLNPSHVAEWNKLGVNSGLRRGQNIVLYVPSSSRSSKSSARSKHARKSHHSKRTAPHAQR